jgi:hypothetical protein
MPGRDDDSDELRWAGVLYRRADEHTGRGDADTGGVHAGAGKDLWRCQRRFAMPLLEGIGVQLVWWNKSMCLRGVSDWDASADSTAG